MENYWQIANANLNCCGWTGQVPEEKKGKLEQGAKQTFFLELAFIRCKTEVQFFLSISS